MNCKELFQSLRVSRAACEGFVVLNVWIGVVCLGQHVSVHRLELLSDWNVLTQIILSLVSSKSGFTRNNIISILTILQLPARIP